MKSTSNSYYNPNLRKLANANRKEMTKAEACLWKYVIGSRKMLGYQFRRQRPILDYIVDFICIELKLIIEVDGLTHQWAEVVDNDVIRQKRLEELGFLVLRFDDDEILNHVNSVYDHIKIYINQIISTSPTPSIPPPAGDIGAI